MPNDSIQFNFVSITDCATSLGILEIKELSGRMSKKNGFVSFCKMSQKIEGACNLFKLKSILNNFNQKLNSPYRQYVY